MILGRGRTVRRKSLGRAKLLIEKLKNDHRRQICARRAPAESALAATLNVGPVALRAAMRSLEAEGFVTFRSTDEVW